MKIKQLAQFLLLLITAFGFSPQCLLDDSHKHLIERSLQPFQGGVTKEMHDYGQKEFGFTCRVKIVNHQIVDSVCLEEEHMCFLRQIAKYLPDMEFLHNPDDRPIVYKNKCQSSVNWPACACDKNYTIPNHGMFQISVSHPAQKFPVFSSATVFQCFFDILYPSGLSFYQENIIDNPIQWKKKIFKAFWRGTSTGAHCITTEEQCSNFHRQRLVGLCQKREDCDAMFTAIHQCYPQFCEYQEKKYGVSKEYVPLQKQGLNKILVDIDGNSYSGRFPFLLQTGSAVFKIFIVRDVNTEAVRPWQHYVPVNIDLSDFSEKIEWARTHDHELEQIGKRGRERAFQVMDYESLQCYVFHLLTAYHRLLIK